MVIGLEDDDVVEEEGTRPNSNFVSASMRPFVSAYAFASLYKATAFSDTRSYNSSPRSFRAIVGEEVRFSSDFLLARIEGMKRKQNSDKVNT